MKDIITYDDFAKLDIRVGYIKECSAPEWSNKLLELTVDFGEEIGERTILTGISKWYSPEDLQDKKAGFIVNLAPRKMGESESQGMMIMADSEERPTVFFLPDEIEVGTVIR